MKKPVKVRVHALIPESVRDLMDRIALKASARDFEVYSRSDVVHKAVMLLAKKEGVS